MRSCNTDFDQIDMASGKIVPKTHMWRKYRRVYLVFSCLAENGNMMCRLKTTLFKSFDHEADLADLYKVSRCLHHV